MGCPHEIKVRAGPYVLPAQRRPGPVPPTSVPARFEIIVNLILILALCRDLTVSPPLPPGVMPSAPSSGFGNLSREDRAHERQTSQG
jgi:hypothetical protein